MTLCLFEAVKDFWEYAEQTLSNIDRDFFLEKIDKQTALKQLKDLEDELNLVVKLENPKFEDHFLYVGIAAWINNVRNNIILDDKNDESI